MSTALARVQQAELAMSCDEAENWLQGAVLTLPPLELEDGRMVSVLDADDLAMLRGDSELRRLGFDERPLGRVLVGSWRRLQLDAYRTVPWTRHLPVNAHRGALSLGVTPDDDETGTEPKATNTSRLAHAMQFDLRPLPGRRCALIVTYLAECERWRDHLQGEAGQAWSQPSAKRTASTAVNSSPHNESLSVVSDEMLKQITDERDREIARLWSRGQTVSMIGARMGLTAKRINNKVCELRRVYKPTVIPYRRTRPVR